MSKTVIVFTTRYIENGKLFAPENCELIEVTKFTELAAFWGKIVQKRLKGKYNPNILSSYEKEYAVSEDEPAGVKYWTNISKKIQTLKDNTELAHLAEICSDLPFDRRFKFVYKLKSCTAENEVYALYTLPEERDLQILLPEIDLMSFREEWIKAIKTTFRKEETDKLYLVVHGSTDYGVKGPFQVHKCDDENVKFATFYHEISSDKVAQLLNDYHEEKSAEYITTFIKRLFVESKLKQKAIELQNLLLKDCGSIEIRDKYTNLVDLQKSLLDVEEFCKLSAVKQNDELSNIIRTLSRHEN